METPLVSVIMSTLNTKEEYLKQAIKSILEQTYTNLEFIIIVDGGNDDKIIEQIKDDRIKIIKHEKPQGLAKSLNEAIDLSKGKYIARMDSDDIALPARIKTQVEYMEQQKKIDITATYYEEFGKNEKKVREHFIHPEQITAKLFYINSILHPSVMFRKEFLDNNNIKYDEEYIYSQDYELWTRISKIAKIQIIPKIEMKYRIHDSQISTEKFQTQNELYKKILKRNLKELDLDESNIKYILMLNSREPKIEIEGMEKFIKQAIEKNKQKKIYNPKKFKKILKTAFLIILIKNKKFFTKAFFKNARYILYYMYGCRGEI